MLEEISIIKQVEIPEAVIKLRSDGIVHVHYKKNTILDVGLQVRMLNVYNDLTECKKLKVIFSADEDFVFTKEARENASAIQKRSPISYYAIIANNLAYKIIANFYIRVVKPEGSYKLFGTVEAGTKWLSSLGEAEI